MQNLAPQLFEDTPLRLEILSGPLADHWETWQGDPIYWYKITFASGMTGDKYERQYRQALPKAPYDAMFFEDVQVSLPIFQHYPAPPSEANQERLSALVATALDEWQQSQQS
jgi:hypothetical protein